MVISSHWVGFEDFDSSIVWGQWTLFLYCYFFNFFITWHYGAYGKNWAFEFQSSDFGKLHDADDAKQLKIPWIYVFVFLKQ